MGDRTTEVIYYVMTGVFPNIGRQCYIYYVKWYPTEDKLPDEGEEVLIRTGENYFLAEFEERIGSLS